VALATGLAGCGGPAPRPAPTPTRAERLDRALAAAGRFLAGRQSADGAWRSEQYASFKDGTALTPLAVVALRPVTDRAEFKKPFGKGIAYLESLVRRDGTIAEGRHGLNYPVYTAALAVVVLSAPGQEVHRAARDAWLEYLRRRQLTENLGWQEADREYGGWGYSIHLPRKPRPGALTLPTESNLSATLFALEALRAAGCPAGDPAFRKARVFVQRQQNFSDPPRAPLDDGGFHFIYDDGARNKAGVAGKDSAGRERFHSYGSATADGLRALRACGLAAGDNRVMAARRWLERHFRADTHPGAYVRQREPLRGSVYYYYTWSVARAFRISGLRQVKTAEGPVLWAEALAGELLKRQRADGSWVNPAGAQREDDPLVATSLAAAALAECRSMVDD
jgi:squalene-hopene/tetraprenyl-beta-curcumene cyclase